MASRTTPPTRYRLCLRRRNARPNRRWPRQGPPAAQESHFKGRQLASLSVTSALVTEGAERARDRAVAWRRACRLRDPTARLSSAIGPWGAALPRALRRLGFREAITAAIAAKRVRRVLRRRIHDHRAPASARAHDLHRRPRAAGPPAGLRAAAGRKHDLVCVARSRQSQFWRFLAPRRRRHPRRAHARPRTPGSASRDTTARSSVTRSPVAKVAPGISNGSPSIPACVATGSAARSCSTACAGSLVAAPRSVSGQHAGDQRHGAGALRVAAVPAEAARAARALDLVAAS